MMGMLSFTVWPFYGALAAIMIGVGSSGLIKPNSNSNPRTSSVTTFKPGSYAMPPGTSPQASHPLIPYPSKLPTTKAQTPKPPTSVTLPPLKPGQPAGTKGNPIVIPVPASSVTLPGQNAASANNPPVAAPASAPAPTPSPAPASPPPSPSTITPSAPPKGN